MSLLNLRLAEERTLFLLSLKPRMLAFAFSGLVVVAALAMACSMPVRRSTA